MKGAELKVKDRVIRVHAVQTSEIQEKSSALRGMQRHTSSLASSQDPDSAYGERNSLDIASDDEERLHERLVDLETQAVQDGEGISEDFGGKLKLFLQTREKYKECPSKGLKPSRWETWWFPSPRSQADSFVILVHAEVREAYEYKARAKPHCFFSYARFCLTV